jgi:hypothetical protein
MMTDHLIAVAQNLPLGTTPESVSELLWTRIGFEVPPSIISVRESQYSASAFVRITEAVLVAFLNRNFEGCVLDGQRTDVHFQKKIWRATEHNRVGIRKC